MAMRLPLALLGRIREVNFRVVHWPGKIRVRDRHCAAAQELSQRMSNRDFGLNGHRRRRVKKQAAGSVSFQTCDIRASKFAVPGAASHFAVNKNMVLDTY
jgi:hypothetical protein